MLDTQRNINILLKVNKNEKNKFDELHILQIKKIGVCCTCNNISIAIIDNTKVYSTCSKRCINDYIEITDIKKFGLTKEVTVYWKNKYKQCPICWIFFSYDNENRYCKKNCINNNTKLITGILEQDIKTFVEDLKVKNDNDLSCSSCINYKKLELKIIKLEEEINKYKNNNLRKKFLDIGIDDEEKIILFIDKYKEYINNDNLLLNTVNTYKKQEIPKINDNYLNYIFQQDPEKAKNKKFANFKKYILKSKFMTFCKYLYDNKEIIKQERDEKIKKLRKKMEMNIIKNKTINILRNFNENHKNLKTVLSKIKKDKNNIKFENKKIHNSILKSNRYKIEFLSNLYEEKEINNSLSSKDFMLAVNEFHTDKNITRMKNLCYIMYNLRKSSIIIDSEIIFNHIYVFQKVKEYQIDYLIKKIEKMIVTI